MAVLRAFKAIRPINEKASEVAALPYDVMNRKEAKIMAHGKPYCFLHVDKAEIDLPDDTDAYDEKVYLKARENLERLINDGVSRMDDAPSLYIYKQVMKGRSQVGIVGCASIDDYINNVIKKHEFTRADKERDRINHVSYCDANTGPIFLTYRNNKEISAIVNDWMENNSPCYDFSQNGIQNTVWVIDDSAVNDKLTELFDKVQYLYIADGHHRAASAVKVGQMKREQMPDYDGSEEFNFFLAVLFPDNELEIMDYNRVVADLNGMSSKKFIGKLSKKFDVKKIGTDRFKPKERHTFGMYLDGCWYKLTLKEGICDESNPVGRLDVSVLQNNVLDDILGIVDPRTDKRIDFIGGIRGLEGLEIRCAEDMKLAFAMYPTSVSELMDIADSGNIMPPKSTWFEPKLLSGLFIHKLS